MTTQTRQTLHFHVTKHGWKDALVVSFLAVLELVRERLVDLTQTAPFAPIYVKRADGAAAID